jgi:hypothetical protein
LVLPEADIEALESAGRLDEAVTAAIEAAGPPPHDRVTEHGWQQAKQEGKQDQRRQERLEQAVEGARRAVEKLVTQRATAGEAHPASSDHHADRSDTADTADASGWACESEAVSA